MSNITRVKKGESIMSGKVLVTCTVTIIGLWSHSGTGEEWADDDNGMTSADAQAFKRACSCFGLGRYFYDIAPIWVDLDQHRQPVRTPALSAWALPENWRKGMRPQSRNGDERSKSLSQGSSSNGANGVSRGKAVSAPANGNGRNCHEFPLKANGSAATNSGDDLDQRILEMEKAVGSALYRNVLREYGRVNQPKLIRDTPTKRKVLQMLESATRGFGRLEAVTKRLEPKTATNIRVSLDAFIGEEGGKAHLVSVVGGDVEIGALAAAFANGDSFSVMNPYGAESMVSLGEKPICFRGSISLSGRKRPLRHLVSCSQELADTTSDGKLLLVSDDHLFIWSSLVCHYGLPATPEWGAWVIAQLQQQKRIQPLAGFGYAGVLVKAKRKELLALLRKGLRTHQLAFPLAKGPVEWPEIGLAKRAIQ